MFRTAMLRSAFRAASAAAPAAARPATQRTAVLAAPRAALPRLRQTIAPVRMYGAAACQSKEQVEGRIMSLLQGFDKVSLACCRWHRCWEGGGRSAFGRPAARRDAPVAAEQRGELC